MQKISRITIKETTYEVKFPTVGQFLEIENIKMALTNGRYYDLLISNLKSSAFALRLTDAIAHFSVLIPDLKKDLNYKSYNDVDAYAAKTLIKVYEQQFLKWYQPLFEELVKQDDLEEEKGDEDDNGEEGSDLTIK